MYSQIRLLLEITPSLEAQSQIRAVDIGDNRSARAFRNQNANNPCNIPAGKIAGNKAAIIF
jgi:hypothetical protein